MHSSEVYTAIGLMSGTSLDGVDVALLRSDGGSYVEALAFQSFPYDEALREVLRACFGRRAHDEAVKEAEALLTGAHIEAVASFGHPADVIGFHGQTLTHDPAAGFTWQIGDGALLARETGMEVVCDFRSADVKAGGQGAPLVPLYHQALAAPLDPRLPCTGVEYVWACRAELAVHVGEALAYHTRAMFLDAAAASAMAPRVAALMAAELGRDEAWIAAEVDAARQLAEAFSLTPIPAPGTPG